MLINLIVFNLSIIFILFLPGYFLLKTIGKKRDSLMGIETLTLSFALSIIFIDFLFIFINKVQIPINQFTATFFPGIIIIGLATIYFIKKNKQEKNTAINKENDWGTFLKIFMLLIVFAVVIKAGFLFTKTMPSATDLGHHMYWAKYIQTFHHLPDYGMPDFIIGEHIIFGIIAIISNISLISTMPMTILFLINFFSLFALTLLGHEIATNFTNKKNAKIIALLVFIAIGLFYAIASPQAKFVSGGVIGNIIGNLLIPLLIFSFLKSLRTKKIIYPIIFVFFLLGIIFTHHLSTFVFLFISLGFIFLTLVILTIKNIFEKNKIDAWKEHYSDLKVFLNIKYIVGTIVFGALLFLSRIPSYLNPSAVDTAVGTPSKETRIGLSLMSIVESAGPWRFFYAGIGTIFLLLIVWGLFIKSKKITGFLEITNKFNLKTISAIIFPVVWFGMVFVMSYKPGLLKIDIPSNRIASYISFPAALLCGFGIFYLFKLTANASNSSRKFFSIFFVIIFGTGVMSGLSDVSNFYEENYEDKTISQVFAGSEYLAEKTKASDIIIKDHIYMPADTWVKLFLMRDYKNPLSRSILRRYEDSVNIRETCTRDMIAIPDSPIGKSCFDETGTSYVFLKKGKDDQQFENSPNFSKIFSSQGVVIFQRN